MFSQNLEKSFTGNWNRKMEPGINDSSGWVSGYRIPDTGYPDTGYRIPGYRIPDTRIPNTEIPGTALAPQHSEMPLSQIISEKYKPDS